MTTVTCGKVKENKDTIINQSMPKISVNQITVFGSFILYSNHAHIASANEMYGLQRIDTTELSYDDV